MSKKFKVVCERFVTDIRGHEICPGNVAAISQSGQSSKTLLVGIVTRVTKGAITIATEGWMWHDGEYDWYKIIDLREWMR